MTMKRLTGMMAMLMAMTIPANAETLAETEEVQETQQKTVNIPAWINASGPFYPRR